MEIGEPSLRALMRNASELIAVLAGDGRFAYVGPSARRVFGLEPGGLRGQPLRDCVHPDDRGRVVAAVAAWAASRCGDGATATFRLRDGAGAWRHVEATACNRLDDPEVAGIILNVRDIGRRVDAEERLRASEALYHTLADAAPVGIFQADAGGRLVFANRRLARLAGLEPAAVLGTGWLAAVHPDDRARLAAEWARGAGGGGAMLTDFRFLGPEGTAATVLLQSTPLATDDGRPLGCVGTVTDMSEYVRTVEALQVSQARTEAIVGAAADAILTIDEEGIVHSCNRAAEEMFGLPAAEILWHPVERLMPEPLAALHGSLMRRHAPGTPTRVVGRASEVMARRGDGTLFPIELSVSSIEVNGRRLFTGIVRDVTERKRIERELIAAKEAAEAADRAKSAFLATMSHELRTPLNAVIGFAQVIEMRLLGPEAGDRYTEYAASIRRSGEHLLAIIDDILDISKIEAGSADLAEQPVDLTDLVGQALNLIAMQAGRRGVALVPVLAADVPPLRGDERRLRQILLNLLSNAVKFTEAGGTVTVATRRTPDGGVDLAVVDTGIGMAAQDIPKALAPFGQVDQSLSRRHGGTGLGLPLTQRLVELHGGRLAIDSAPGRGTTVTVHLPPDRVTTVEAMVTLAMGG